MYHVGALDHTTSGAIPLELLAFVFAKEMEEAMGMAEQAVNWQQPSGADMEEVFQLCRQDDWICILHHIKRKPLIAITSMIMDNHISTTVLHQAITSKGNTQDRAEVIQEILKMTPQAAAIKNGYGSLPLHVIAQRNTKMDASTKELLIQKLVLAYKEALIEPGGVGKRTPLHIIFTGKFFQSFSDMVAFQRLIDALSYVFRLYQPIIDSNDDR